MSTNARSRFPFILLLAIFATLLWNFAGAEDYARAPRKDNGKRIAPQAYIHHPPSSSLDDIYTSPNTPFDMQDGPDGLTIDSIVITDDITIEDVDVKVDITHNWVRDITLVLKHVSTEGLTDSVMLTDQYPYGFAHDMTQTWFADEAGYWILQARPPMAGTYRPIGALSKFNGRNAAGTWYMEFRDRWAVDTGRVNEWALEFNHVNSVSGTIRTAVERTPVPYALVTIVDTVDMIVDTVAVEIDTLTPDTNYITDTTWVIDILDSALARIDGSFAFPRLALDTADFEITHAYTEPLLISGYPITPGSVPNWRLQTDYLFATAHMVQDSLHIPDNGLETRKLTGFDELNPFEIVDVDVVLDVTHPNIGNLRLNLETDNGDKLVDLVNFNDHERGDNLLDCRLDDEAYLTLDEGIPPYAGHWQPTNELSFFDGLTSDSNWTFTIFDKAEQDSGDLYRLDLIVVYREVGGIEGHAYRDSLTGRPLVGASVTILGSDLYACTDQSGKFSFPAVAPGEHTLTFNHKVYKTVEPVVVTVVAGESAPAEVALTSAYGSPLVRQSRPEFEIPDAFYEPDTTTADPNDSIKVVITDTLELVINDTGFLGDLNVSLSIDHAYLGDLRIRLIGTDTTTSAVLVESGNGNHENFVNTIFDDQSCDRWQDDTTGYTGTWLPAERLSVFDSMNVNGTWFLEISDQDTGDFGILHSWSLECFIDPEITESPILDTDDDFTFHGNYPNPFNPSTTFAFDLIRDAQVKLIVYNVLGQQISTLIDAPLVAGIHQVAFDAGALPSGIYFARLSTPHQQNTRKVILIR